MRTVWLSLALVACSGEDPVVAREAPPAVEETTLCPVTPAGAGETVVLVRDTGFDLKNEVFQGRIGGCYRIRCREQPSTRRTPEQARQALLDELSRPDDRCRLEPGVTLKRSPAFASIAARRDAWNAALASDTTPDSSLTAAVEPVVQGDDGYLYHGTAVAGLIAQQNPRARLVLVSDDEIEPSDAPISCPSADDIQRQIELYEDPQVRAAFLAAPADLLTQDLRTVLLTHRVSLLNESFGSLPSASLEKLCPGPWRRFFELTAELTAARASAQAALFDGLSVLTLRAAGNEAQTLDSPADALDCGGHQQPDRWGPASETMMVGALALEGWVPTSFSNLGACVDAFAPGQRALTWAPQNFLVVQSGTSFAAPLVARLATGLAGDTAAERRAALAALSDADRRLPRDKFPAELLFQEPVAVAHRLPALRRPPLASLHRWAFR